jgi:hypothetical protein
MVFADGRSGPLTLRGRARDVTCDATGSLRVVADAQVEIEAGQDRTLRSVSAEPTVPGLDGLVGGRGGGRFRGVLESTLAAEREAGTPLYFLLDDVPGATLIAGYVWTRWPEEASDAQAEEARAARSLHIRSMEDVCSGWRAGGTAMRLRADGSSVTRSSVPAPELDGNHAGQPAWHEIPPLPPMSMRRRRRVDVHVPSDTVLPVVVEAMFRDTCSEPLGTELVVHEYRLDAEVDQRTGELMRLSAEPRVLPFPECPLAADNVGRLVGLPVRGLRASVLEQLVGIDCCTHLNDLLR